MGRSLGPDARIGYLGNRLLVKRIEQGPLAKRGAKISSIGSWRVILNTRITKGVILQGHPEVLAQAFLGMFFSYVVLHGFLLDALQPEISPEEVVVQFVSLFVRSTLLTQE